MNILPNLPKYQPTAPVERSIAFGKPVVLLFSPCYPGTFLTADIFPTGIPVSESDQKDTLYTFVKNYLGLEDYTDEL